MRHLQAPLKKNNMRRIHLALQQLSVDTSKLYLELGINPQVMADQDGKLDMLKHIELLERAAQQTNNPFLGMGIALDGRNSALGVLSYMLRNATNIEKALELIQKYIMLVDPGSSTKLLHENNECIWVYKLLNSPPVHCSQSVEWSIFSFVRMLRLALGDNAWQPMRIYLEHCAPATRQCRPSIEDDNIVYGHDFSGVCFSQAILQHPNSLQDTDQRLLALLESQAKLSIKKLLTSDSLAERICLIISSNLGKKLVTANTVAKELAMSRSTLHRRLREDGTTFHALRENIIIDIAKQSLSSSSIRIAALAQKLGYSDSSSFHKAFKRLVGHRPLVYRKQNRDL